MSLGDITNTMQILLGSAYVNDFDFNNRSYRVYVQADQQFRSKPERHRALPRADRRRADDAAQQRRVGARGDGAARASTTTTCSDRPRSTDRRRPATARARRFRRWSSCRDRVLPQGMTYAWSGLSLEEIKAGSQSTAIFGLGLLLVYLTLAAQYESVTLPFIILLSVPLAILGALLAQWGRGLIDDVYCQIGLVMLIGLSAKNGILIVEFAEQLRARGMSIADAAVEAARIRLRPILMTSLAFILGVMPLVVASGAGREARHSVGHRGRRRHDRVDVPQPRCSFRCCTWSSRASERSVNPRREGPSSLGPGCDAAVERSPVEKPQGRQAPPPAAIAVATAQAPPPIERVTFRRGDRRAIEKNPTGDRGGPGILRAEGLLRQARAATRLQIDRQRHDDDAEHRCRVPGLGGDAAEPGDRVAHRRHADRRRRRLGAAGPGRGHQDGRRSSRSPTRVGRSRSPPPTRT